MSLVVKTTFASFPQSKYLGLAQFCPLRTYKSVQARTVTTKISERQFHG